MKSFELLLGIVLIACIGLSFTNKNNFGTTPKSLSSTDRNALVNTISLDTKRTNSNADTLSRKELLAYVNEELIEPIRTCFLEKDPHMFMTKCYTKITFEPNKRYEYQRFYKDSNINGSLILIDCSVESRMADVQINYKNKTIIVKESFTSPSVDKDKYLNNLCKYVKKNGVPDQF